MKFLYKDNSLFFVDSTLQTSTEVTLKACFPWERPQELLSAISDEGKEVALIDHLSDLNEESKKAVLQYLSHTRFVIEIDSIVEIIEDVELRKFTISSQGKERIFFMELDHWPEVKTDGSIVFIDLAGDIYKIKSLELLGLYCQKKLSPYLT